MSEAKGEATVDRDLLIGMAWAATLIAVMAGIFFYEQAQFDAYDITWDEIKAGGETRSGALTEEASESYTFMAEADRISSLSLTLSWTDDVGAADTFEVVVTGPEESYTATQEAATSPLEVTVPIHPAPETTSLAARSPAAVLDRLDAADRWTDGSGAWQVNVTLVSAPGEQTPVGGQETAPDGSQDYELVFSYARWEPALRPVP